MMREEANFSSEFVEIAAAGLPNAHEQMRQRWSTAQPWRTIKLAADSGRAGPQCTLASRHNTENSAVVRTILGDRECTMPGRCDGCVVARDRPRDAPRVPKGGGGIGDLEGCVLENDDETSHGPGTLETQPWPLRLGQEAVGRGSTKNSGSSRRADPMASGSGTWRFLEKRGTGACESSAGESAAPSGGRPPNVISMDLGFFVYGTAASVHKWIRELDTVGGAPQAPFTGKISRQLDEYLQADLPDVTVPARSAGWGRDQ